MLLTSGLPCSCPYLRLEVDLAPKRNVARIRSHGPAGHCPLLRSQHVAIALAMAGPRIGGQSFPPLLLQDDQPLAVLRGQTRGGGSATCGHVLTCWLGKLTEAPLGQFATKTKGHLWQHG